MDVAAILTTYGYPALVLGAVIEGETLVVAAGYLAHRHNLPLWPVIACASLGATIGDQGFFLLGRKGGERAIARLPAALRKRIASGRTLVAEHPVRVLLSMRFVYGMRIALPVLCGTSTIHFSRFAKYNVATAIAWATIFAVLGYAFGAAATRVIHDVERYEWWMLLAIVVAVITVQRVSVWRASRR